MKSRLRKLVCGKILIYQNVKNKRINTFSISDIDINEIKNIYS